MLLHTGDKGVISNHGLLTTVSRPLHDLVWHLAVLKDQY